MVQHCHSYECHDDQNSTTEEQPGEGSLQQGREGKKMKQSVEQIRLPKDDRNQLHSTFGMELVKSEWELGSTC